MLYYADQCTAAAQARIAELESQIKRGREVMLACIIGIGHLDRIAREWEPDHSSGVDRQHWVRARDARDDADIWCRVTALASTSGAEPAIRIAGSGTNPPRSEFSQLQREVESTSPVVQSEPSSAPSMRREPPMPDTPNTEELIARLEHAAMGFAQDRSEHTERRLNAARKILIEAQAAELARLRDERVPAGYVNGDELADLDREASISLLVEGEATNWCKTPIYTATAQPAPSVEWSSADGDRCLEALFSAAHEHGESGRGFREDARRIIAEMMPAQPSADARDAACTWTWQEGDEVWATSCGDLFALGAGTPKDNGMRWCCYCRAAIDAAAGKEKT
jgi:hypothetical protein